MAAISKRVKALRAKVDSHQDLSGDGGDQAGQGGRHRQVQRVRSTWPSTWAWTPRSRTRWCAARWSCRRVPARAVRVAVFTQGEPAKAAKAAGADLVGLEDLAAQVKEGKIEFDVAIASPDAMRVVGQLGQILGPRGLMPNPKVGTVTQDVAGAVKNAKAGQVQFRTDKGGIVQCTIGRASFTEERSQGELGGAARCAQQGQAVRRKGSVSEEGFAVQHHGCWRARGPGEPVRATLGEASLGRCAARAGCCGLSKTVEVR